MLKTITCIRCPKGCLVTLDTDNPEGTIKGFSCPNGREYAINELTHPMRTISSTVEIRGGIHPRIPVKTNGDIPKEKIMDCVRQLKALEIKGPVKIGQVILENAAESGVPVIATASHV